MAERKRKTGGDRHPLKKNKLQMEMSREEGRELRQTDVNFIFSIKERMVEYLNKNGLIFTCVSWSKPQYGINYQMC